MGSVTLSNPQTLNLYAYCTNDPVNYVDPSGLGFFSFLKKLFKWVMVAIAVIVAVITIVGVVTTPFTIAGLLGAVSAGAGAAASVLGALGYQKAARIFGIIAMVTGIGSLIAAKAGMSSTFTAFIEGKSWEVAKAAFKAFEAARDAGLNGLLTGVGSVVNSFQGKKETPQQRRERLIRRSINSALWRLNNMPGCKEFIQGNGKHDPIATLESLKASNKVIYDSSLGMSGPVGQVHGSDVGKGSASTLRLGDKWFDDWSVGQ